MSRGAGRELDKGEQSRGSGGHCAGRSRAEAQEGTMLGGAEQGLGRVEQDGDLT